MTITKAIPTKSVQAVLEMDSVYTRLFNTRDGQKVLSDMCRQFYDTPMIDNATLERLVGRRDVVHHIKTRMLRNVGRK